VLKKCCQIKVFKEGGVWYVYVHTQRYMVLYWLTE